MAGLIGGEEAQMAQRDDPTETARAGVATVENDTEVPGIDASPADAARLEAPAVDAAEPSPPTSPVPAPPDEMLPW